MAINIYMATYSIQANDVSQTTPVLQKGPIRIEAAVSVYWTVGENPTATNKCALLMAGQTRDLRLPVKCSRIAFMAVKEPGYVTVSEQNGGASSSCS